MGDEAGVVESVKAASDLYAPISGTIIEVNSALEDEPETVNEAPHDKGWFFKMRPADLQELEVFSTRGCGQASHTAHGRNFASSSPTKGLRKRTGATTMFKNS